MFSKISIRWRLIKRFIKRYLAGRIYRRLILNYLGVGVLPILIVSFVLISLTQSTVKSYIFQRNLEIARSASKEISLFIKDPLTILSTITQTRDIIEMERFTQSRVINKIKIQNNLFRKIDILDQTGNVVVTTSFEEEMKNYSNDPAYKTTMNGEIYFSEVYFTPSRFPVMQIALPIIRYNTVEGILIGEIDLKNIWELVDKIIIGQTGNAFLISSNGSIIAHPEKQKVLKKESYKDYEFYYDLQAGKEGVLHFKSNGENMLAAYSPVPELSWGIIVQQSDKEAFELARKMRNQVIIFVSITMLLALIMAIATVRKIIRPLENLVLGVREYAGGNLLHRIHIERQDELAVLAQEFNVMAESLEKNQKRLRRMERLAALSRFASLVSHEIRNPLNAMNINMQILRRLITQTDSPPNKKIKYLNIISSEISRINSLVSNFLAITHPPELNPIKTEIHQILEEVILTLEAQAQRNGIDITRKYLNESLFGMYDYNQLKQVFHNIILNSFDAMPSGGKLSITVNKYAMNTHDGVTDKRLIIEFKDNGQGIPKEKLNEIFEFYYTTKKTGTGIGLAIAKQIIEAHKGKIDIDSILGDWTIVKIELPLEK